MGARGRLGVVLLMSRQRFVNEDSRVMSPDQQEGTVPRDFRSSSAILCSK
jgi:hypothetical protein